MSNSNFKKGYLILKSSYHNTIFCVDIMFTVSVCSEHSLVWCPHWPITWISLGLSGI